MQEKLGIDLAMDRVRLKIHGRVQGVFFRACTRDEAVRLNVNGWVRNTVDGCVEVVAEGDRQSLDKLVAWCRHGPSGARVDTMDISWERYEGTHESFRITH